MGKDDKPSGVNIGNVSGGIQGSIIAGGNVSHATITVGGKPVEVNKDPQYDEFIQLLKEIQEEIAGISSEEQTLKEISAGAPLLLQAAGETVNQVADKSQKDEPIAADEGTTLQGKLQEASNTVGLILNSAKSISEKATEAGKAIKPLIDKLRPLAEKVGVAAIWAAKLWIAK
jgi:hypothetical protein